MNIRSRIASLINHASGITGAVFVTVALLSGVSCGKRSGTPDWDTPGQSLPAAAEIPAEPTPVPAKAALPEPAAAPKSPTDQPADAIEEVPNTGLRFITYNVRNWLTMDRYVDRKNLKGAPKPESERQAVVSILHRHAPDVIGFCEIGTAGDLAEIQAALKAQGLDLPHSHYTGGSDPVRHLGLLSRFPIKSTAKPTVSEYQLQGKTFGINRGILDATIEARDKSYRFVGVHLKSKRDVEEGDQESIRLNEARLLRRHVDAILETDPDARLVVYGDLNDTRSTPVWKTVTGNYNDPAYLTAIPVKDSQKQSWTHFWALQEIYSRIDYVMVSKALKPDADFPGSKIIDDSDWLDGSDHRPILAIFN